MKKIMFIFALLISMLTISSVKADTFQEAEYISGEYINKEQNGKTYYLTVQFIKNEKGEIVYCLEPFKTFTSGTGYSGSNFSYEYYTGLSSEIMRRIEKLAYYGYNYVGRTDPKWYAITQYLIWKTVDSSANIYFTNTLNGKRINKYEEEIAQIEADIKLNDTNPSFAGKSIEVNYKSDFVLEDINKVLKDYKVLHSDYKYEMENNKLSIKEFIKDGKIVLKRNHDYYNSTSYVFVHKESQMLFKPGNPRENEINVKFKVTKGDILLNVYGDDSIYTVESDFSNTCYGIYDVNDELIERVCTDRKMSYKTNSLAYGNYYIKQESVGIGYVKDNNIYKISIDKNNENVIVELKNKLIRNTLKLNKKYCKNEVCINEENSKFNVYDKNNNLVNTIITDSSGKATIELGYGNYTIEQVEGKEGYKLVDVFNDSIVDEESDHEHNLKNEWIAVDEDVVEEVVADDNVVLPPDTGLMDYRNNIFLELVEKIVLFLKKLLVR